MEITLIRSGIAAIICSASVRTFESDSPAKTKKNKKRQINPLDSTFHEFEPICVN